MSDAGRVPRAVLDTDIIFSRVLHDLFGRLALRLRLLDLLWSDDLLAEARRKLIEEKALSAEIAERWVGYLAESFPAGRIEIADVPASLNVADLTADPEDHHVCALAVVGDADYREPVLLTSRRALVPNAPTPDQRSRDTRVQTHFESVGPGSIQAGALPAAGCFGSPAGSRLVRR